MSCEPSTKLSSSYLLITNITQRRAVEEKTAASFLLHNQCDRLQEQTRCEHRPHYHQVLLK